MTMHFVDTIHVIGEGVFSRLSYNDLLRLRLVCKVLQQSSNEHLQRRHPNQKTIIEIDENAPYDSVKTLKRFVELGFAATKFYMNISSEEFFVKFSKDIPKFLEKYGEKIVSLRVQNFYAFTAPGELYFYSSLKNLKRLHLINIDATKQNRPRVVGDERQKYAFPANFRNLEALAIDFIEEPESGYDYEIDVGFAIDAYPYQWNLFEFCEKLTYFKHGLIQHEVLISDAFEKVGVVIQSRREKYPNGPHLEVYDIRSTFYGSGYLEFLELKNLLNICQQYDVKLINVDLDVFTQPIISGNIKFEEINLTPITSICNLCPAIFYRPMTNVEEVITTSTQVVEFQERWNHRNLDWPELRCLDVTVDSAVGDFQFVDAMPADELMDFLIGREGLVREKLTELRMRFSEQMPIELMPFPTARSIISHCPNLTKLSLCNYSNAVTNRTFSKLWEGLIYLETLHLEDCERLGNSGFVGKDVKDPTFFRLTRLKKFSLSGLDKMPKVTDTLFKTILRHMKLTHLNLQSDEPIQTVTVKGIDSLLTGVFAETIEKFPFHGWSLDGTSSEAFSALSLKFRSSYMI